MGQPDWSKIPPDKWPEWKRQEMLKSTKQLIDDIEQSPLISISDYGCEYCGRTFKSKSGLRLHSRIHNK